MAAGNTYVALATETLTSAQASVTFSSISGAYTDLVLVMSGKIVSGGYIAIPVTFNGDTGYNYSRTYLYGDGSAAYSGRATGQPSMALPYWDSGYIATTILNIMNYSNSTTYKTVLNRNSTNATTTAEVGLWRSTAAITSIVITPALNFASGSTFQLFGIAAA